MPLSKEVYMRRYVGKPNSRHPSKLKKGYKLIKKYTGLDAVVKLRDANGFELNDITGYMVNGVRHSTKTRYDHDTRSGQRWEKGKSKRKSTRKRKRKSKRKSKKRCRCVCKYN